MNRRIIAFQDAEKAKRYSLEYRGELLQLSDLIKKE
jgi:hypothetical protein